MCDRNMLIRQCPLGPLGLGLGSRVREGLVGHSVFDGMKGGLGRAEGCGLDRGCLHDCKVSFPG